MDIEHSGSLAVVVIKTHLNSSFYARFMVYRFNRSFRRKATYFLFNWKFGNIVIIFDNLAPSHHKQINYEKNYTAIPIIYF